MSTPNTEFFEKVRKTVAHYVRQSSRGVRGGIWDLAKFRLPRPIFIVGCSRAGTTLVYKTFSESRELGSLQRETHDFWAELHPPAERAWASHTIPVECAGDNDRRAVQRYFYRHTGRRRFVDKNNQNGLSIPYLLALFPDALFVYVRRAPGDNVLSLMEGWNRADEFATWADDLPAEVRINDGKLTRWCFFLADGWRDYLTAPLEQVCAFQYRAMNQAILDARALVPAAQWVDLPYESLLRDPTGEFRRAFERCGLAFGPKLSAHCENVLERPYNAFSDIKADKWRSSKFAAVIERVLPSLEPIARDMGYLA